MTRRCKAIFVVLALHVAVGVVHAIPRVSQPEERYSPLHQQKRQLRAPISDGPRVACQVTTVHDGDTFRCRGDVRVRLLLIDAPEIDQPLGPAARDALRAMVPPGATVWLEFDVQRRDRYGRTLAYVWTAERGGRLVNFDMAEAGWVAAVVFPPNVRRVEEIRAAVQRARQSRRGMWASDRVCEPIDHKKGRC
jgi:micrococcal nuclease